MRIFSSKLLAGVLAVAFGATATAASVVESARHAGSPSTGLFALVAEPALADRDDNENNGRHDNGNHYGHRKHNKHHNHGDGNGRGGDDENGGCGNGSSNNGGYNNGGYNNNGDYNNGDYNNGGRNDRRNNNCGDDGNNNGGYGNGGHGNGGYNNGCNSNGRYGGQTLTGYAFSGVDSNGNFSLKVPAVQGVPLGFTSYTVHVTNNTCVSGRPLSQLGYSLSRQVRVIGNFVGDGRTIVATQIFD